MKKYIELAKQNWYTICLTLGLIYLVIFILSMRPQTLEEMRADRLRSLQDSRLQTVNILDKQRGQMELIEARLERIDECMAKNAVEGTLVDCK